MTINEQKQLKESEDKVEFKEAKRNDATANDGNRILRNDTINDKRKTTTHVYISEY
jgi:hypothetical protein